MRKKIMLVLLTAVFVITVANTASAMEWHKTNAYTFNESVGEPAEIYFWTGDGNFVLLEFNWSGGLVKIIAQANEPILGIQKAEEFQSILYPASPYRAFPVGERLDTWWETEDAETLVQFYWVNHEGPSWWQFDTGTMDMTAEMWNSAVQYRITTDNFSISIEEWKNY